MINPKKKKSKMPMNFNVFGKGKPLKQPKIMDTDGDGVPDLTDCAPWNKNKHGKVTDYLKAKLAKAKEKRAYKSAASQQIQKVAQAEYYRAKEEEAKKLARYRAEQERKKQEERYKYKPQQPRQGQGQQRTTGFIGSLNVPPAKDIFGNELYPRPKQQMAKPSQKSSKKKRKKKSKSKKKKAMIVYV